MEKIFFIYLLTFISWTFSAFYFIIKNLFGQLLHTFYDSITILRTPCNFLETYVILNDRLQWKQEMAVSSRRFRENREYGSRKGEYA